MNAPFHDSGRPQRLAACWQANEAAGHALTEHAEKIRALRAVELENLRWQNQFLIRLIEAHARRLGKPAPVLAPEILFAVGL